MQFGRDSHGLSSEPWFPSQSPCGFCSAGLSDVGAVHQNGAWSHRCVFHDFLGHGHPLAIPGWQGTFIS